MKELCAVGAVVGKKIVGVVGLLYLCGLIGEMCAQLFCISGMGGELITLKFI